MQIKFCSSCLVGLPISCFEKAKYYKDGYRGECRSCRRVKAMEYKKRPENKQKIKHWVASTKKKDPDYYRNSMLKNKYGITLEQFKQMSTRQDHKCALCFFPASKMRHKALCVDHCHETGRVRGLLCHPCNTLLGRIGDNIEGATRMLEYVRSGSIGRPASSLVLTELPIGQFVG